MPGVTADAQLLSAGLALGDHLVGIMIQLAEAKLQIAGN